MSQSLSNLKIVIDSVESLLLPPAGKYNRDTDSERRLWNAATFSNIFTLNRIVHLFGEGFQSLQAKRESCANDVSGISQMTNEEMSGLKGLEDEHKELCAKTQSLLKSIARIEHYCKALQEIEEQTSQIVGRLMKIVKNIDAAKSVKYVDLDTVEDLYNEAEELFQTKFQELLENKLIADLLRRENARKARQIQEKISDEAKKKERMVDSRNDVASDHDNEDDEFCDFNGAGNGSLEQATKGNDTEADVSEASSSEASSGSTGGDSDLRAMRQHVMVLTLIMLLTVVMMKIELEMGQRYPSCHFCRIMSIRFARISKRIASSTSANFMHCQR